MGVVDGSREVYVGAAYQGNATGIVRVTGYTACGAAGYRLPMGGDVRFTPPASIQATHVDRDAFTETGAGGQSLTVGKDVRTLYTATAEGRLSYLGASPGGIVEPYVGGGGRKPLLQPPARRAGRTPCKARVLSPTLATKRYRQDDDVADAITEGAPRFSAGENRLRRAGGEVGGVHHARM